MGIFEEIFKDMFDTRTQEQKDSERAFKEGEIQAKNETITGSLIHELGDAVSSILPTTKEHQSREAGYHGYNPLLQGGGGSSTPKPDESKSSSLESHTEYRGDSGSGIDIGGTCGGSGIVTKSKIGCLPVVGSVLLTSVVLYWLYAIVSTPFIFINSIKERQREMMQRHEGYGYYSGNQSTSHEPVSAQPKIIARRDEDEVIRLDGLWRERLTEYARLTQYDNESKEPPIYIDIEPGKLEARVEIELKPDRWSRHIVGPLRPDLRYEVQSTNKYYCVWAQPNGTPELCINRTSIQDIIQKSVRMHSIFFSKPLSEIELIFNGMDFENGRATVILSKNENKE